VNRQTAFIAPQAGNSFCPPVRSGITNFPKNPGCKNQSVTAAFKYEIAADVGFRTPCTACAKQSRRFHRRKEKAFKAPLCRCSALCSLCLHLSLSLFFLRGKEWDEIFLNSNYLAGIRHAGING